MTPVLPGEPVEIVATRSLVWRLQPMTPEVSKMPDKRLARNPAVVCTDIDDGAVLLDLESTAYYSLNRTGLRIWNFLEEARTLDGIATHLVAAFEVDRDQALTSAQRFVSVLEQEGLIRVEPA